MFELMKKIKNLIFATIHKRYGKKRPVITAVCFKK